MWIQTRKKERKYFPYPVERFNLIVCIEVFEHVADVGALMADLDQLCAMNGGVLFTTVIADAVQRCQGWAYCIPRSGHIIFYSQDSLMHLFSTKNFNYSFLGEFRGYCCHFAWRGNVPYLEPKKINVWCCASHRPETISAKKSWAQYFGQISERLPRSGQYSPECWFPRILAEN